jgi:enolase
MTAKIKSVLGREVLDSRGFPTVHAEVILDNGFIGRATAPAGASTGKREAAELRDGDPKRYYGKGVLNAVRNVREEIGKALAGKDPTQQREIDQILIQLDGTGNKGRLGANAIVAVSMAVARAGALAAAVPLYRYLSGDDPTFLPVPQMNVINGGRHAENSLDMQEFMIVPLGASSFSEALRMASETFQHLKQILRRKGYSVGVGDEGGFAPDLGSGEEAMGVIAEAIEQAGYRPGDEIAIALDPAASEFYDNGNYVFAKSGKIKKTSEEMVSLYAGWIKNFPIVSIEDGLAEDDWSGWKTLTKALALQAQLVGDDIFVTDPELIRKGIEQGIANAVLIKLNQIGTVSETLKAIQTARGANLRSWFRIVPAKPRTHSLLIWRSRSTPGKSRPARCVARNGSPSTIGSLKSKKNWEQKHALLSLFQKGPATDNASGKHG